MQTQGQYLEKDDLINGIKYDKFNPDDLISSDAYNEQLIMEKYNKFDDSAKVILLKCAIHISVIGAGNKTYGAIRDTSNNVVQIKDIFSKYGIEFNKGIQEKYDKDTLSARRLVRLLRYHIQKFIIENKRPSYLWFKYSDKNQDKVGICFPGAEHLIVEKQDAEYLLSVYKNVDNVFKTKFTDRLKRVFIARRVLPAEYFYNV
jgi:hypothetical protein